MAIGSRDQPMVLDSEEDDVGPDRKHDYAYAPKKRVKMEGPKKERKNDAYRDDMEEKEDIQGELRKLDDEVSSDLS